MLTVEAFKNDHRVQLLERAEIKKKSPCDQLLQLKNTLVTSLLFSILEKEPFIFISLNFLKDREILE